MKERRILKENKLPGTEKLTRPEEISILSKYLGELKEDIEELTDNKFHSDLNYIPGVTTGLLKEINELPNKSDKLVDAVYEIDELENYKEKLSGALSEIGLNNTKVNLDNTTEISTLEQYIENLETSEKISDLSNYKENLETESKVTELNDYKENLKDTESKVSELGDYKEGLGVESKVSKLEDYKENLETPEKISDLSDYKENLKDTESKVTELNDYKENLGNTESKITELNDYKENLETESKVSNLSDYKENLETSEKISDLSDYKENLETESKVSNLEDHKENLNTEESKVSDLSNYREDLKTDDEKVLGLDDYRENLKVESKIFELPNTSDKLTNTAYKLDKLEDHKEELSDVPSEINLNNTRVDLNNTTEVSNLGQYIEDLQVNSKVSDLEDYKENLNAESKVSELGSYIEELSQESKVSNLSDYKENLKPEEKVDKLSDVVDKLNSESKIDKLSDYKENISDTRNVTLDNTREDLKNIPETSSLSQYVDELKEEEKISELSDFIDDLDNFEDKVSDLSNYKENLQIESKVSDLEDHKEILDNSENNIELNDQTIELEGDKKSIEGLGDELLDVPEDNSSDSNHNYWDNSAEGNELHDTVLQPNLDKSTDPNHNYWDNTAEGNELYNIAIQNLEDKNISDIRKKVLETAKMSDDEAFNQLIKMLECKPESWEKKLAGVVSTYLIPKKLTPDRAKEFKETVMAILEVGFAAIDSSKHKLAIPGKYYQKTTKFTKDGEFVKEDVEEIERNGTNISKKIESTLKGEKTEKRPVHKTVTIDQYGERKEEYLNSAGQIIENKLEDTVDGKNLEKRSAFKDKTGKSTYVKADKIKEARSKLKAYESAKIPEYQLTKSGSVLGSLNLNNYLRWAAENVWGKVNVHGQLRRRLIDETLALLVIAREQVEKATKSNRDRLPGNDIGLLTSAIQGGAIGAIDSTINNAYSSLQHLMSGTTVNHDMPINRPNKKEGSSSYEIGNTRNSKADGGGGFKSALKSAADSFLKKTVGGGKTDTEYYFDNYWDCAGVRTTIQDLCLSSSLARETTVQELFDILKTSPYITTPMKFGTIEKGAYGTYSLDTNAYWEIVFRPFLCKTGSCSNGGFSFLPSFAEMNLENEVLHNAHTCYSEWIPVSNFELQKSKLTTKSLQLYDGEINYPVSVEFTNELRLTFVDDIYKTWRRYFEKCMEVSVFSSEAHTEEYYESTKLITPTVIDKQTPCVAFYKNIVFQITIYILTPQYSTIKKIDLLCVLKEFSEDYIGEIDGSGADLNVSFSIVGENPILGDEDSKIKAANDDIKKTATMIERKNTLEKIKTAKKNTSLIKLL